MLRKEYDDVVFYVGAETEHTPAFSSRTLFVHGIRAVGKIDELAKKHKCSHIKLGMNDTFQNNKLLNEHIKEILMLGYRCTVCYPITSHSFMLSAIDKEVWNNSRFIPIVQCDIPEVETISKNLVVQITDDEFKHTNSGVWSFVNYDLLDRNRRTDWVEYGTEKVILTNEEHKKKTAPSKKTAKAKTTKKSKPKSST